MKSHEHFVSLETIGRGAGVETFNHEFERVLENIRDVNTDPETKREVTLKVTLKPSEDRQAVAVTIAASSKLAPVKAVGTVIYVGRRDGQTVATEYDPQQRSIDEVIINDEH